MNSLRRRLLVYVLSVVLLAAVAGGIITYRVVLRESDEILDYHLRQVAQSLANQPFATSLPGMDARQEARLDLVVQVWDASGSRLYLSNPHSDLPGFAQLGYSTLATTEGRWRVYGELFHSHVIQVAQPLAVRERMAAGMALRVLLPFMVLIPALGLLVWLAIGRGLGSLEKVTRTVAGRSPEVLEPLRIADVPDELRPLVTALNGLLSRLSASMDAQRAFTADAAHELRTPLAALQLQVQMIERSRNEEEWRQAVARLKGGLQRATHMVEQLLALARQEGRQGDQPFDVVELPALAAGVIGELAPIAQARSIDLGLVEGQDPAPPTVGGDAGALRTLLANLVDNALRYTPPGGRVDVGLGRTPQAAWLEVTDTGPGLSPADRRRAFDRFYRGEAGSEAPGSGLGLAIVQRIAQRHGARVELLEGPEGRGLRARVEFPPAP